ncbi:hypothetical protein lbkm_1281 [Lachnospiraceae bacterium KM106-2]|nr:hypothetical protein lbkm_1281 [Lachnospiraceae bacterium KM106-2]
MVLIGLPAIAQFVLIYLGRESSFKAGVVSAILWVAVFGVLAINAANAILCIIIALLQLIPILFGHRFYQNLKKESNYVNHWSSVALEHATFHRS